MSEEPAPRRPRPVWKWVRRVIVWLFFLQTVLIVLLLIYAAYWNRRGQRELTEAIRRCQDQALLEDRRATHQRAAGENRLGAMYTIAFAASPSLRGKYDHLPYIGVEGRAPELSEPVSPELAARLRTFAADNREYFRLLATALDAGAKLPLIDWDSPPMSDRSWISQSRHAVWSYMLLSLLAQAEGRGGEAMVACGRALAIGGILDGQPSMIVGLIRSSCGAMASSGIEAALSRIEAGPTALTRLRAALVAEADRIDLREAARGTLALSVEAAADPDLFKARQTHEAWQLILAMKRLGGDGTGTGISPTVTESRSTLCLSVGISWMWHGLCPGATKALLARSPTDLARWAEPRAKAGNECPDMPLARPVQMILRGKAPLHVAAAALAVEQYRLRNGRWPEKLADVSGPVPTDLFAGAQLNYVRTDDGCMIYSVGSNLTDDGGKSYDQDGDDIVFRLFDVDRRNKP